MFVSLLLLACTEPTADRLVDSGVPSADPLPAFVDDCAEELNDELSSLSGLLAVDGHVEESVQLCSGDRDVYRVDVPANTWLSVAMYIDGSGSSRGDGTDLDLWEVDPESVLPDALDIIDEEPDSGFEDDIIWYSASEQPYERLAWFNETDEVVSHYLIIDGWDGSASRYDLLVRTSEFHEGLDCDTFYADTSEDGPCNRIMQFPQATTLEQGYIVQHEAHYSNLRREVAYLVRYATAATATTFEGTNPLALMDMSQADGDVPGRMVGSLRHPEGTHTGGNDIDIAYYQTGDDNLGRAVCANDGYFCTGAPNKLDARRTAYFMVRLMESPYLRVIGVDPEIATAIRDATEELEAEGLLSSGERRRLMNYMAYGDGWPFHHHHMHFSWSWEDGHSGEDQQTAQASDGCMGEPVGFTAKQERLPSP